MTAQAALAAQAKHLAGLVDTLRQAIDADDGATAIATAALIDTEATTLKQALEAHYAE